ncbi:hypothetical protein R3W88_006655 [Solanum pinnatisectum]|uniref:Retrotransposon Copia-like N-terminal domain-containing protein n=1 Tax=Solanum pinnatisectum TaxID=50273 RepID=A0AAV9KG51_9SOLN|nr:hypothetical protein R3W88_006655 [Solanum pinnatisectum]
MVDLISVSTGSDSTTSSGIDTRSHFCIHPSDNPGAVLVPVPFNGTGFHFWRRSVRQSLSVKNKLVFINGECKRPDANHSTNHIADSVEYVNDALELWTELEDRYNQTNGAKLYQTLKEINDLNQGILDITTYYTRMKKLWEELNNLCVLSQCNYVCVCGAKTNIHKAEQDRHLIQFLMDLNMVYTTIRGSILVMNPLPSMAQAFALLVQQEKQWEFKPNNNQMFAESSFLIVSSSGSGGRNFQTNYYVPNITPRGRPFGEFCRRPGDIKEKCDMLHGYLSSGTPSNSFNSQSSNNYGTNQHQKAPNREQYNSINQAHNTYSNQMHNTKGKVEQQIL